MKRSDPNEQKNSYLVLDAALRLNEADLKGLRKIFIDGAPDFGGQMVELDQNYHPTGVVRLSKRGGTMWPGDQWGAVNTALFFPSVTAFYDSGEPRNFYFKWNECDWEAEGEDLYYAASKVTSGDGSYYKIHRMLVEGFDFYQYDRFPTDKIIVENFTYPLTYGGVLNMSGVNHLAFRIPNAEAIEIDTAQLFFKPYDGIEFKPVYAPIAVQSNDTVKAGGELRISKNPYKSGNFLFRLKMLDGRMKQFSYSIK